jgi:hypothetical protein
MDFSPTIPKPMFVRDPKAFTRRLAGDSRDRSDHRFGAEVQ